MGDSSKKPGDKPQLAWQNQAVFQVAEFFNKLAATFGIPAATLVLCFGVVWFFGDAKTENDFIRELLFRDVTHTPWLSLFFAALVIFSAFGAWRAGKRGEHLESNEMRRLAAERTRLQEKLLGSDLEHSVPPSSQAPATETGQ